MTPSPVALAANLLRSMINLWAFPTWALFFCGNGEDGEEREAEKFPLMQLWGWSILWALTFLLEHIHRLFGDMYTHITPSSAGIFHLHPAVGETYLFPLWLTFFLQFLGCWQATVGPLLWSRQTRVFLDRTHGPYPGPVSYKAHTFWHALEIQADPTAATSHLLSHQNS